MIAKTILFRFFKQLQQDWGLKPGMNEKLGRLKCRNLKLKKFKFGIQVIIRDFNVLI